MVKTHIFQDILRAGARQGHTPGKLVASRNWFRNMASAVSLGDPRTFIKTERDFANFKRNDIIPGYLYSFIYDARHKDKLPFWDAFPIVFPWRTAPGKSGEPGFLGINLHYLPPLARASIMDQLYGVTSNQRFNDNTKLKISYDILCNIAGQDTISPCIHHYLVSQVKSKFYKIPAEFWDMAVFLPTEDFRKASKEQIWRTS